MKERNLSELTPYGRVFEFHELDVRDTAGLAGLLMSDSVLVHLAARPGVRPSIAQPMSYVDVNVGGTASVVEAMAAAGSTRLVFASSSSVYGDDTPAPYREDAVAITPLSPYAASKRAAELLLVAAAPLTGIRVAALRFFTVYGPRQRPDLAINTFVRRILDGQHLTLYGDGTQGRDYTYCSDVVAGIASAIDGPRRLSQASSASTSAAVGS